jgi:hypothetical protein
VEPAATVAVNEVNVGVVDVPDPAVSTSNCSELEVPPPGVGFRTVIVVIPVFAISAAVICAVSCVALTYCEARAEVPQYAVELAANPDPVIVSVKAVPPALVNAGDMLLMTGMGFAGILMT